MIAVESATAEDFAPIRALLGANELPVQDLADSAVTFLVARVDGVFAGAGSSVDRAGKRIGYFGDGAFDLGIVGCQH